MEKLTKRSEVKWKRDRKGSWNPDSRYFSGKDYSFCGIRKGLHVPKLMVIQVCVRQDFGGRRCYDYYKKMKKVSDLPGVIIWEIVRE